MHAISDFIYRVPSVLNAKFACVCTVSCSLLFQSSTQILLFGLPSKVESLQALIKDKTEDYSVLLSVKEQCLRDLEDRNDEIDKMASRIRELEQALLSSAEAGRAVTHLEQELQKAHKSMQELSQVAI